MFYLQGMPNGVYDNIYEDLDDSPVSWHITEVRGSLHSPSPARAVDEDATRRRRAYLIRVAACAIPSNRGIASVYGISI